MFDLFKRNENKGPLDVKALRDSLLRLVKDQLQKSEGGEGRRIKGIHLFINAGAADKHLYEAAVYLDEPERFKDEIQRIADDFALNLPDNWALEVNFDDEFPPDSFRSDTLDAAIFIRTKDHVIQRAANAFIHILNGEAEKEEYEITSSDGKLNIGRESKAQVNDGFFRLNQIAFPGDSKNESNKFISRQHAHIEWNNEDAGFMIFADEGGIPPGNKVKIKSIGNENLIKLHSTHIGHKLNEGDQVILGESAVFEFSYHSTAG
ncbi:MAG: FHA domain-containing protein [Bacteroidota bacterium]|nr:FHA domain-containing protein [Bacteroidota bacterium]